MNMRPTKARFELAGELPGTPAEKHENDVPFADVPAGVWRFFIGCWAAFFLVLWWTFGGHSESAYMVTVASIFGLVFFAVPVAMLRRSQRKSARAGLRAVDTLTGPLPLRDAIAQMVLIPLSVTLGMIAIGLFAF